MKITGTFRIFAATPAANIVSHTTASIFSVFKIFQAVANDLTRETGIPKEDLRVSVILKYPPVPSRVTSREIS